MEPPSYLSLLLSFSALVAVSILYAFYKHLSQYRGPNLPPGHVGLPFIGETLEFLSTGRKGHPEKFFFDRVRKYSSELFKTSILAEPTAVFCGAAGNKFLFSNENKLVAVWWPDSVNKVFPSSRQTSSQEEAIKMRKMLPRFMKPEALQRYIGIMDHIAQRHFADGWENKAEVKVFPLAKNFTFWLACRLFISVEDPVHVAKFSNPFDVLTTGMYSIPIDLPGMPLNKAKHAASFIRKELTVIIKQRKIYLAEGKASATRRLLDHGGTPVRCLDGNPISSTQSCKKG